MWNRLNSFFASASNCDTLFGLWVTIVAYTALIIAGTWVIALTTYGILHLFNIV